jgi:hypothetical protein
VLAVSVEPFIWPTHVMVLEPVDCKHCGGNGQEPSNPKRWCSTCQGLKVRHRAMPLEDFALLFKTTGPWPYGIRTVSRPTPQSGLGAGKSSDSGEPNG